MEEEKQCGGCSARFDVRRPFNSSITRFVFHPSLYNIVCFFFHSIRHMFGVRQLY